MSFGDWLHQRKSANAPAAAPTEPGDDCQRLSDESHHSLPIWSLLALFTALWAVAAFTAEGFLEDDAWTHYFYARFAPIKPAYLFDVWGRPICTALYALAAPWAGMTGCRVIGLLLVFACVALTMRTARALRINDRVAALFLLGQPMLFLHSLSVMTELPFAVLLIAAFLAFVRRRWWLMAALVGLLPLARPEGFGFIALGFAALVVQGRFKALLLLMLPLIAWTWAGWWMWGASPDRSAWWWLIDHWPYSVSSTYGHGFILQFVVLLPVLVGMATPFILLALFKFKDEGGRMKDDKGRRSNPFSSFILQPSSFVLLIPLGVLVVHSLLWYFGKMASFGEIRYLLIVSPFWAMLAAIGWERSAIKPSPLMLAAVGLIVVFACKITFLQSSDEARVAQQVVSLYRGTDLRRLHPRVIASHPAVYVDLDLSPADSARYGGWNPAALAHPANDAIVIWDPKCGPFNADSRLIANVSGLEAMGWKRIATFHTEITGNDWVVMVKRQANDPIPRNREGMSDKK
ncbi:hypothetical protein BH10PLA1_BH10PLA1_08380 [soil metagenome]